MIVATRPAPRPVMMWCTASLAEPEPVSHNITDQLGHIHSRGQILFYVIAALNTDPGQIRPGWRVNLGPDQKTASD